MKHLQTFIREWFTIFTLYIRSVVDKAPPAQWSTGEAGTIVLLPGQTETWNFFRTIADALNQSGYRILVIPELNWNLHSIDNGTAIAKRFIQKNHLKSAILLSHSKGGLIAKALLSDPDISPQIRRSVSIATPYEGTLWGWLIVFHMDQLRPGSGLMRRLQSDTIHNNRIVNLYPTSDMFIVPNSSLRLEGAFNISAPAAGHTRILIDPRTIALIQKHL